MGTALPAVGQAGGAEGTPAFLGTLVVFLCAAAIIGYVTVRLRVVPIVGFLLAGVLIGPAQLGLVRNEEVVSAAADVGVMLLLFTLGIEFSLDRLAAERRNALIGGGLQVTLTLLVTAAAVLIGGVSWQNAVFTGFLVALSSTAIVLKVLAATGRTTRPGGRAAVGVLIFQDLTVVLMVLLVPLLGPGAEGAGPLPLLRALGTAVAVIAVVLLLARRLMPPLLERVARACSPEVFLLTVIAIALGTAYLTSLAGVSISLGAFLSGLIVSESRHSSHALGEVLPLQILFSAVFFVSIGMQLDLGFVGRHLPLVLGLAAAVVAIKAVTGAASLAVLRLGLPTAVGTALLLSQIGEFSFVLQQTGRETGLTPAGLGTEGEQVLVAVTVLLMALTPLLSAAGDRLGSRTRRVRRPVARDTAGRPEADGLAVLISGWGPVAAEVAAVLRSRQIDVTVTTLSPDLATAAERAGHTVVTGDPSRQHVLAEAGLERAAMVVIPENETHEAARIAEAIRTLAPDTTLVVRPIGEAAPALLDAAGADRVIDGTEAIAERVTVAVLAGLDQGALTSGEDPSGDSAGFTGGQRQAARISPDRIYPDTSVVVDFRPDPETACPHVTEIRPVLPKSPGCTDCLRQGRRDWVHLHVCLTCGYVGCCDSSPQRHARAHGTSVHPITASAEPGDEWGWCFLDETQLDRDRGNGRAG